MDWSNDNCPVCNAPAREALPRMGDVAEIICDSCGRYRITGSAIKAIRYLEPGQRQAKLQAARKEAAPGVIPRILA